MLTVKHRFVLCTNVYLHLRISQVIIGNHSIELLLVLVDFDGVEWF